MDLSHMTLKRSIAAFSLGSLLACTQHDSATTTHIVNDEDPRWISRSASHPNKIAIVFIHGIFGSTLGTWSNDGPPKTTFFQLVKDDPEIGPKVDIYAFGFTSKILGSGSLNVPEAANKLQAYLDAEGIMKYPAVVFVGHSMGGLVILRHLVNSSHDSVASAKTPVVFLLGTPQEGSQLATLGTFALDNPALTNMAPADNDNTFLQQLNEDWLRIESKPHVSCAYEKKPYKGAVVVGWSSSTRFCSEVPLAIDDEDHLGIAKPNRALHPSVVALKRALVKYALPIQMEAQLDTPDFQQKDDRLQFTMNAAQGSARLMNRGRASLKYWVANKSSPSLYIVPGESPQSIGGNQIQQVDFLLLADANDSSYDLTLKTDPELPQELNVKVVVSNLNEIRSRHASQVALMLNNVEAFLADQETASEFAKLPANDPKAMSKIAEVAFNSVTASNAALSDSAKWVIVADSLATARIGRAAGIAINKAEMGDATNADSLRNLRTKVEKLIIDEGVKADEKSNLKKLSPEDLKAAQPPRWLLTPDYVQGRDRLIQRMAEYPATRNAAIPINLDEGHAEIKPAVEKSLTYGGMSQRIDKPLNSSMQEGSGRPIKIPLTREKRILEEKKTLDFPPANADRQLDEPNKRQQKPTMNRLNRE